MQCPAEDAAHLASVARDICPFPNYNPSPLFINMLTVNSSVHLRDHYMAVQSSLTTKQLEEFTQDLRTTFGREGKVTLGGVGVVALSLAVLFDTLAKKVRGEWVPDSGPIPGLFLKDLKGYYPPNVYTVSEYLRLVPHIANNPTRMREESERYYRQLLIDERTAEENRVHGKDGITGVNIIFGSLFQYSLENHLLHITNSTVIENIGKSVLRKTKENPVPTESKNETGLDAAHISKTRKRRIPPPETTVDFNLNCDPDAASKDFLAEVQKSNISREALNQCRRSNRRLPKTWLHFIAGLVWMDVINDPIFDFHKLRELQTGEREDFDLKANALIKWAE